MCVDVHGQLFMSVIRKRGSTIQGFLLYTTIWPSGWAGANVHYREVSAIQGSVIEGFQCT